MNRSKDNAAWETTAEVNEGAILGIPVEPIQPSITLTGRSKIASTITLRTADTGP